MESSNLWLQIKHCSQVQIHPSAYGIPSCFSLPTRVRALGCSSQLPSQDPIFHLVCVPSKLWALMWVSHSLSLYTHALPCNELNIHKPFFILLGTLARSNLAPVICVGLFCLVFCMLFNEAALFKKKKKCLYTVFCCFGFVCLFGF